MKKIVILLVSFVFLFSGCQSKSSVTTSQKVSSQNTTSQKSNAPWVKAYCDYIEQNADSYNPGIILIDLDFDGVPEMFNEQIADGGDYYLGGVTYKNGKVIPLQGSDNNLISDFVGTTHDDKGKTVWYTRYFPCSMHSHPSTEMYADFYDFSSLPKISKEELLDVSFNDLGFYTDKPNEQVTVKKIGKEITIGDEDRKLYIKWWDGSLFDVGGLPAFAHLESSMKITPQKSLKLDLWDCFKYPDGKTVINYQILNQKMQGWF